MLLTNANTQYISTLTHEGKVLIVATVFENGSSIAKLYYTVKQDGFEDSALQNPNGSGWETFKEIPLPNDAAGDPSVVDKEKQDLTDLDGNPLLRSRYATAELTHPSPVQLMSHDGYVYLFRRSTEGNLLVDRFVLDGMSNTLTPKIEVRFKRSRMRYKPFQEMKINSIGQLESADALDFRDMNGSPFYAPSIELFSNRGNSRVIGSSFAVVITATTEPDTYRWHIFSYEPYYGAIHLLTLRADSEYIFDVKDAWSRSIDPVTEAASYSSIPGIIHRAISLRDTGSLNPTNGLAAVKYDVQRELETENGLQLVRDASKVLLAVPTNKGIAALSFDIAANGTLAQIANPPTWKMLRNQEREILLPLDLLDNIRAVGDLSAAPGGKIIGMSRSTHEDAAERVQVSSTDPRVQDLSRGDLVQLTHTKDYNGLYPVTAVDKDTFIIDSSLQGDNIGDWVKVELKKSGLVFDGELLGYEIKDGKLKVTAFNHGLATGDRVQIVGSSSYDGEYPVLEHDNNSFTVQRLWATGQAVNIQVEARKRRGLILDGSQDWIEIPLSNALKLNQSFTFEAWVKPDAAKTQALVVAMPKTQPAATDTGAVENMTLGVNEGRFAFALNRAGHQTVSISDSSLADLSAWTHLACVCHGKTLELFKDGASLKTVTLTEDIAFSAATITIGAFVENSSNAGAGKPQRLLQGQLAEVRLWTTARPHKEINDSMYLQLKGREQGLAGYWRLGGVAVDNDGARRVYDFSVNANHGKVNGNPYAGGIVLNRTLGDNKTPCVQFVNDELVAVREGAAYVERFEFRAKMSEGTWLKTPLNADGNNAAIFAPSLWGRLSRDAEDKTTLKPLEKDFKFEDLGDGWWSAACRFLVPEGVRLLRGFEVTDVAGAWQTLEIRRPRLTLVSDTVTQSDCAESVTLEPLTGGQPPAEFLRAVDKLQRRETLLASQIKVLQRKLAASQAGDLSDKVNAQIARVNEKKAACEDANNNYSTADSQQRFSYANRVDDNEFGRGTWVDARPLACPFGKIVTGVRMIALDGWRQSGSGGHLLSFEIQCAKPDGSEVEFKRQTSLPNRDSDKGEIFDFEYVDTTAVRIPDERYVTAVQFYKKGNERLAVKVRTITDDWKDEEWQDDSTLVPNASFRSVIDHDSWRVDTNLASVPDRSRQGTPPVLTGIWFFRKELGKFSIAPVIGYAQADIIKALRQKKDNAQQELAIEQKKLDDLNASEQATKAEQAAMQARINTLQASLDSARNALVSKDMLTKTAAYLTQAAQAQTPQPMPALKDTQDPLKLTVQGALLPFAVTATRLQAIESCTGHVTLTYLDADGALRQTNYDTTYDADGKGEEWIPDRFPTALEFAGTTAPTKLPATLFKNIERQVTIEFWCRGDTRAPSDAAVTFLAAANKDNQPVLQIQLPNEKGEVVWQAGLADGAAVDRIAWTVDERLYRGNWTHWAFVKDADAGEMRMYANGRLCHKNNPHGQDRESPLTQSFAGITQAALGGTPDAASRSGWQGQIAELRIWNVALGSREIEANSRLPLRGNEPGLCAYYPFNEAQGNDARDLTGQAPKLMVTNATWVPCPAPFGRLIPPPIYLLDDPETFDGKTKVVELPPLKLNLANGLTIEVSVWSEAIGSSDGWFNRAADILGFGSGADGMDFVLSHDVGRVPTFEVYDHNQSALSLRGSYLIPTRASLPLSIVFQTDGNVVLYEYGVRKASGKLTLPPHLLLTNNFLGKSERRNSLYEGALGFVRFHEYAMDAEQVMASARDFARGGEASAAEYSRVHVDGQNRKSALMVRVLAAATTQGVQLMDEQRIEELETTWVSNTQIKPTLIGYIEGAPPAPSENLTEEQDYNGATSVELIESSDVEYSWTREQDLSAGATLDLLIGGESETLAGLGVVTSIEEVHSGAGGHLDFAYHWQNASTVGASHSLMKSDRLNLSGGQEEEPHFPQLGLRFVPKNIGYAVVISGLGDLFVTKLKRSGRVVSYQILPVKDVPLDVNTITFLMNPAYTMAGSLDGLTGSHATSEHFFAHVPDMRSQYGSLYPASYFRLKEAYDLKAKIDQQDEERQAYFEQFNSHLVDQWSMERQVGDTRSDGAAVSVNAEQSTSGDLVKKEQEISETEAALESLKKAGTPNAELIKQTETTLETARAERDKLKARQKEEQKKRENEQKGRKEKEEARLDEIEKKYQDPSTRAHASDSFHAWQKRMEDLQIRAGKRNIVNTYVWDADGGYHAEEQQFASMVEHSIGGSFDLAAALGGQASIAISKVLVAFNSYAQFNMSQTMSKAEHEGKALELHVDLSGVESRGITDFRDNPILPGEKVDRYRFMSFFLENSADHWHDFFNYVVHPEWLASNDEEARALRQTQSALPNKVWRVLHRVTYVERPALMGFGRTLPASTRAADDIRELRKQVDELKRNMAQMQKDITAKLDQLLSNKG